MSERERISDEIRRWFGNNTGIEYVTFYRRGCDKMRDLADRIDREMLELPKDRDGVPIHVGDTVWLKDGRVAIVDIVEFIQKYGANIKCWTGEDGYANRSPEEVSHESHDSLERMADELDEMVGAAREWLAGLAERIRKLAKEGE